MMVQTFMRSKATPFPDTEYQPGEYRFPDGTEILIKDSPAYKRAVEARGAEQSKPTNPKDAIGIRKLPFSVLPWRVLCGVALAMLEGACKYGRHNYREAGVRASVYFDAVVGRHLTQWWEGEDLDAESNLHHIDKAIAGLMVMRDSMLAGNFVDDRPPRGKVNMESMNMAAGALLDKHADKSPRHWTIADSGL